MRALTINDVYLNRSWGFYHFQPRYGCGNVFWPSPILFPLSDLVSIDNSGLFPDK